MKWHHAMMGDALPPAAAPPTPRSPDIDVVNNFFMQTAGALLTMLGVGLSVLGLHGMKVHGVSGRVLQLTKTARWYGYVGLWSFGQALQLLAVKLAEEPVVAAFSNFAIIVNAALASRLLGEKMATADVLAIATMIAGSCLVVVCSPQPQQTALTLQGLQHLLTSSSLPAAGLLSTGVAALFAAPIAVVSAFSQPHAACARSCADAHTSRGPLGGVAFGLLAGWAGATSVTAAKLCWLLFDTFVWRTFGLGVAWLLATVAFAGEVGMVVFLFNGMAHHEAAVVVSTYYITLTCFASVQGLCVFNLLRALRPASAAGFVTGIALCILAVAYMARVRAGSAAGPALVSRTVAVDDRPFLDSHAPGLAAATPAAGAYCGAGDGVDESGAGFVPLNPAPSIGSSERRTV